MQVDTIAYTEANPELPLHLKIGINAGEPIAEDNDLFGTTVQLSARITDKAQGDQIFVSDTVYGICQGKGMQFVQTKKFDMKGFDGGLSLWEVVWREEVLERALEDATEDLEEEAPGEDEDAIDAEGEDEEADDEVTNG